MPRSIAFIHLLNDFSGSPRVLGQLIQGLQGNSSTLDLHTSDGPGFLSDLPEVNHYSFPYRHGGNRWSVLFRFMLSQIMLFFRIWKQYKGTDTIVYINTLLPFGAALGAKLLGLRVIYHIHETSLRPVLLKYFLRWIAAKTADEVIHVSEFLMEQETIKGIPNRVIYNSYDQEMADFGSLNNYSTSHKERFQVLMLGSLKDYKGVPEYIELAHSLPELDFQLVLNASRIDILDYFKDTDLPSNLRWWPSQKEVIPFYRKADLVVNLSRPDQWIETFGLTLLEAMLFGIPVIAPPIGGPTEVVQDGQTGYLIDCRDSESLHTNVLRMANSPSLCSYLSANAKVAAKEFSPKNQVKAVGKVLFNEPETIPNNGTSSTKNTFQETSNHITT